MVFENIVAINGGFWGEMLAFHLFHSHCFNVPIIAVIKRLTTEFKRYKICLYWTFFQPQKILILFPFLSLFVIVLFKSLGMAKM
jgi:hypothetical protein